MDRVINKTGITKALAAVQVLSIVFADIGEGPEAQEVLSKADNRASEIILRYDIMGRCKV
ncbi:hypothetical protein [Labrys okinawensis]|uniref:hypothetical protein n=1 Tax=Labrys okinawensis TaxID=346911 RepID=UPI0011B2107F|nr:hypothetical protein [Labrys okinawensis]